MSINIKSLQEIIEPAKKAEYNVTDYDVTHLDYQHIAQSTNVHELKFLSKVLKSGKEGYYPEMEEAIESRIEALDHSYARKQTEPLDKAAIASIESEFSSWMKAMKSNETEPKGVSSFTSVLDPSRHPRTHASIPTSIKVPSNATPAHLFALAEYEKTKGNESFRGKEFEEAIAYYTRSIAILPRARVFTNRCLAHMKMKNYDAAERDATNALACSDLDDAITFKALLRRGQARFNKARLTQALQDFEEALVISCADEEALGMKLKTLEKLQTIYPEGYGESGAQTMRRMSIEEIETEVQVPPAAEAGEKLDILVADETMLDGDLLAEINDFTFSD